MAVSWVVLVVTVVVVAQAECASIRKPQPVANNQVDIPESPAHLEVPDGDSKEKDTTVSSENQVKLNLDDPGEPPDGDVVNPPAADTKSANSHTITSEDFAAKTGVVSPQESEAAESAHLAASESPMPKLKKNEKLNPSPGEAVSSENDSQTDDFTSINSDLNENGEKPNSKSSDSQSQSMEEVNSSNGEDANDESTSYFVDDISTLSLDEMSQKISDGIKTYSNDVTMDWEGKKGGVSWAPAAESALKDYMEKISIAQSANKSDCVKVDIENHASRSKTLQNVIESCRSNLKQEQWHKLQEKTKETLNLISDIVQEAIDYIEKLSQDDPDYFSIKSDIENKAKQKLQEFNSKDLRRTFSKMKEKSIKSNDDEYKACFDDNPEQGMIVDTLNDIMRIKNNCVG